MRIDPTRYEGVRVKTAEGKTRHSKGNGDNIFNAMVGLSNDELTQLAADNGLKGPNEYSNWGQFRMNLGNALRGIVNRNAKDEKGVGIQIGAHVVTEVNKDRNPDGQLIEIDPDHFAPERQTKAMRAATGGQETEGATDTLARSRKGSRAAPAAKKTGKKTVPKKTKRDNR